METLSNDFYIAKKQHKCNFCGEIISIGEKYHSQKNKYDGLFYTWKTHISCDDIADKLNMFYWADEGVTGDDFVEFITEEYNNLTLNKSSEIPSFRERLDFVKTYHLKNDLQVRK